MQNLSVERVHELLDYNLETGQFVWKVNRGQRVKLGDVAGFIDASSGHPYRKIRIEGRDYQASRLAVVWMTGEWPKHEVDHKNRDTVDNRWANLRLATRNENQQNRAVRKDSSTQIKGVTLCRSAHGNHCEYYVAKIGVGGKRIWIGSFKTAEEARTAYILAAKLAHGKFART